MLGAIQQVVSEKICTKCGYLKSLDRFPHSAYTKDGTYSYCKECANNNNHCNYAKRTGRTVEEVQADKANRITKIVDGKKKCSICNEWKLIRFFSTGGNQRCGLVSSCKSCTSKKIRAYQFKETKRVKLICMMGYGGKCVCCGDSRIEMLTIEHIRYKGYDLIECSTTALMKELIRQSFPEGYTILCSGCNQLTRYGKPCIHSKEYQEYCKKNIELHIYAKQKELDELERKWDIMNGGLSC
jgi:hypothetical protein